MKFALPAMAAVLLWLWLFFTRRRLKGLEEAVDQELERFSLQQFSRFESLAALMELTDEYEPHALMVRPDSFPFRRDMTLTAFTLEEAERRDRVMSGILNRIIEVIQLHPEMQADERYFKCMSTMSMRENLYRTKGMLYNSSVGNLHRELRTFPTSIFKYLPGFQMREYLETLDAGPPIYTVFPPVLPCSICAGDSAPPSGDDRYRKGFDNGGPHCHFHAWK